MDFADVIRGRYACRAYLPQQIPQDTLNSIFEMAARSPSNCNVQPWHIHVLSGDACENMRQKMTAAAVENPTGTADFKWTGKFRRQYRDRQVCAALGLWDYQGITREDKEKRNWSWMRNFAFFDAPHVAFVFMANDFDVELRMAADVGMYVQSLMLSMYNAGVGSCPQTSLSFYPALVREELGIDDSYNLLMGLSFGYADTSDPANDFRTERAPLEETTTFYS